MDLKTSMEFRVSHTVNQINQILATRKSEMHMTSLQWAEWQLLLWSQRILSKNFDTPYFEVDLELLETQLKELERFLDHFRTSILCADQNLKLLKFMHAPKLD